MKITKDLVVLNFNNCHIERYELTREEEGFTDEVIEEFIASKHNLSEVQWMYGNMLYCDDVIKVELQSDKVQPIIDEMNSSCETFCDLIDDIVEANVEDNNNIASAFRKRFGDKRVNALKKILNTETSEE